MANPVETVRPSATVQLGTWTVVGATNAHHALSDNSDDSYVQLIPRCRLDDQVLKLAVTAPPIPPGAKIFSVGIRIRVQTVAFPAPSPICLCHHSCTHPILDLIVGILDFVLELLFILFRPPPWPTAEWVEQSLGISTTNPAGQEWTLADFNPYVVTLSRDDDFGVPLRISEIWVDVAYNSPPTVTVSAPTGTNTTTSRPHVAWRYGDAENDPQQAWQARVFTAEQYSTPGFDPATALATIESGWTSGTENTWPIPIELINGEYQAYVRVSQVWTGLGTNQSAWASTSWTQQVPGAPPATMLDAEFDPALNRVKLQVRPSGAEPPTVSFTLQASRDAGVSWSPVRGGIQIPTDPHNFLAVLTVYDYEAPLNQVSHYRALAYRQFGTLRLCSTAYSNDVTATPISEKFWLKDVLNPSLNTILPVAHQGDSVTQQKAQGVFSVLTSGRQAYKVAVTGPRYGIEGTFTLVFTSADPRDYWAALHALDASGRTLLLQYPDGQQHWVVFGPGSTGSDMQWTWDIDQRRHRYRVLTAKVSYTEVAPVPIGA